MDTPTDAETRPTLLPSEIMDTIASNILQQKDLLHLALAHSTWRDIVIPFHLHYRTVKCADDDGEMWAHLKDNPRRIHNVRSFELQSTAEDEPVEQKPPLTGPGKPRALFNIDMLESMVQLRAFRSVSTGYKKIPRSFQSLKAFQDYREVFLDTLWTACAEIEEVIFWDSIAPGSCSHPSGRNELSSAATVSTICSCTRSTAS